MMKHFGSTFCFLGFLFIQAKAIPSWKTCSAHSDCQATGEYCEEQADYSGICEYCSGAYGGKSIDDSIPAWCSNYAQFGHAGNNSLTSTSVLTFTRQSAYQNGAFGAECPTFDSCLKNCRKEYLVEKTATQITLTSTFTDTTDCVCDKIVFSKESYSSPVGTQYEWNTNHDFGISVLGSSTSSKELYQYSSNDVDIEFMGGYIRCLWHYSISSVSSSGFMLNGLLGVTSAIVIALVLT